MISKKTYWIDIVRMKVISFLIIFLCTSSTECSRRFFIQSRFTNLERYATKLIENAGFNPQKIYDRGIEHRFQFCKNLLSAPLYQFCSEVNFAFPINDIYHEIEPGKWELLKEKCNTEMPRLSNCVIEGINITLSTLLCLDHDSNFNWLAAYDMRLHTGLLFSATTQPFKLLAMFDSSFRYEHIGKITTSSFRKSIDISNSRMDEPLCQLHLDSQFRLCSICADAVHRRTRNFRNNPSYRIIDNFTDRMEFMDPNFNFYYKQDDNCPMISVRVEDAVGLTYEMVKALYCHVTVRNKFYGIYIKKMLSKESDEVFIILEDGEMTRLAGTVSIRQMKNIFIIDTALKNMYDNY